MELILEHLSVELSEHLLRNISFGESHPYLFPSFLALVKQNLLGFDKEGLLNGSLGCAELWNILPKAFREGS